ncbi:predicted esterase [Paenibacillus popilliae ATCC 14706]|uniref:Predicted esterase n=1 Tax=Paenibacillus popilliae ATCC 14706 TaxID=1212764 RepID=M9LPT2_PAEPP|nr:predicted esterase [Paenibacillus popilliae ATCC 14706]
MAECMRAGITEAFRIRKLTDTYAIHNDDTYSFKHVYHSSSVIQVVYTDTRADTWLIR